MPHATSPASRLPLVVAGMVLPLLALAADPPPAGGAGHAHGGPCGEIAKACKAAGFVEGGATQGTGLFKDCLEPIMRGTPSPSNAKLALPTVDPAAVSACKARRPDFGEGRRARGIEGAAPPPADTPKP